MGQPDQKYITFLDARKFKAHGLLLVWLGLGLAGVRVRVELRLGLATVRVRVRLWFGLGVKV